MSTIVEAKVKEKIKKETIKKRKAARKPNNSLDAIFGMLKGKIHCDDAIFNLEVKA